MHTFATRAFVVAVIGWLAVWKFGLREEHRLHEKHDGDTRIVRVFSHSGFRVALRSGSLALPGGHFRGAVPVFAVSSCACSVRLSRCHGFAGAAFRECSCHHLLVVGTHEVQSSFPLYSCPVVPIVAAVYVYVAHLTAFHL